MQLPPSINHPQYGTGQVTLTVHPLTNYVSYTNFYETHKAILASIAMYNVPKSFGQEVRDERWKKAMQKEIEALQQNKT